MSSGFPIECDGCDQAIEDTVAAWIGPDMTGEATFGMSVFHSEECAWRYHDRHHPEFNIGCASCRFQRARARR